MQDRYAGDVGDFGKIGLLKRLAGGDLRLAVLWYRVPDEAHNGDGRHIGYLQEHNEARFGPCDPALYSAMRDIVQGPDGRSVAALEGLFPNGTMFHGDPLVFRMPFSREERERQRREWVRQAASAAQHADIVFLDPDNGMAPTGWTPLLKKAPKYVFEADLPALVQPHQSMVMYHHANFSCSVAEQARDLLDRLRETMPGREVFALIFRRGTCRIFALLPVQEHLNVLRGRIDTLLEGPWRNHFEQLA